MGDAADSFVDITLSELKTYTARSKDECLKPDKFSEAVHFIASKKLGEGAYGQVYIGCRVHDDETKDPVCTYAIKYSKLAKYRIPSYRLELTIMKHLAKYDVTVPVHGSWICTVKTQGRSEHFGIIIMDRGIPYDNYFAKRAPTDEQLYRLFDRTERMHDLKVMHLDLSHANLIVHNNEIYPIDFGLAVYTAKPLPTRLRLCDYTHLLRGDFGRTNDGKWAPHRHLRLPGIENKFLTYFARRPDISDIERRYLHELWELACMLYSIDTAYSDEEIVDSRAPRQAGVMYGIIISLLSPEIVYSVGFDALWSNLKLYSGNDKIGENIKEKNYEALQKLFKEGKRLANMKRVKS